MSSKVVVHRAMSLDGFVAPGEGAEEAMAATGAMLRAATPSGSARAGPRRAPPTAVPVRAQSSC